MCPITSLPNLSSTLHLDKSLICDLKSKINLKKNSLQSQKVLDLPEKFEDLSSQIEKVKNDIKINLDTDECNLKKEYDAI